MKLSTLRKLSNSDLFALQATTEVFYNQGGQVGTRAASDLRKIDAVLAERF